MLHVYITLSEKILTVPSSAWRNTLIGLAHPIISTGLIIGHLCNHDDVLTWERPMHHPLWGDPWASDIVLDVFFDNVLNKLLNMQSICSWFVTPLCLFDVNVMLPHPNTDADIQWYVY